MGVTGELCIGGLGVVRGYFGDEVQTNKQFVWHEGLQQRLYRTGDLGRYFADGNIEFMGRLDSQLKIRGFRIELGEIEKTLAGHHEVKDCLVIAKAMTKTDKSLVGYVVPHEPVVPELELDYLEALRQHLLANLPQYMVPSAIVLLERIPLTANGKVDRKALPEPDFTKFQSAYIAPRNAVEQQIADIWCELLGHERIGIEDNFFDVGGHSLLAARLVAQINHGFGIELTLVDVFNYPNLAQLSQMVASQQPLTQQPVVTGETLGLSKVVKLNQSEADKQLFFINPGAGLAYCYQYLAAQLGDKANCYGINSPLIMDEAQHQSFTALVAHYVELVQQVQPDGHYHLVGYSSGGVIAHEMAAQLRQMGHEVSVGLIDSFATMMEYQLTDDNWYAPVRLAVEEILLLELDYDWSQLNNVEPQAGEHMLAQAMIDANIRPHYNDAGVDLVAKYLRHFRWLHDLKKDHQISRAEFDCVLYKAAEAQPFEAEFSTMLDWDKYNPGTVDKVLINGRHEDLVDAPVADELALALAKHML